MRKLTMGRRMVALTSALGFALALVVTGASGATAGAATLAPAVAAPEMGIRFFPDGDAGQCSGPQQQFVAPPSFTTPIRFDTDSRPGGCQFAFGIYDPNNALAGLSASYGWTPSPGGDASQCGPHQGTFTMPISAFQTFGTQLRDDTDNRAGWCNLTFTLSGRTDIALLVQFWADGDPNQCHGALPRNDAYTVTAGAPLTLGLDTDNRVGGCWLALSIQHSGF